MFCFTLSVFKYVIKCFQGILENVNYYWILLLQPQNTQIWIGGNDLAREGNWIWQSSGDDLDFSRFNPGEPNGGVNENCLGMLHENGNWVDSVCAAAQNFHVCEKTTSKPTASPKIKPRKKI